MVTTATSTLYQKILAVMQDVEFIEKRGFNDFHKYKYAQEADIVDAVRKSCVKNGLVILPKADPERWEVREFFGSKNDTNFLMHALIQFEIIDTDTGESHTVSAWGAGTDKGDKAAYKAFTGAQKYALMKAFQIPTGDDPEAFADNDRAISGTTSNGTSNGYSSSAPSSNSSSESLECEECGKGVKGTQKYTAEQRAYFIRKANDGRLICKDCGGG